MKIVITGGAGFVGGNLYRSFLKDGNEVVLIDKNRKMFSRIGIGVSNTIKIRSPNWTIEAIAADLTENSINAPQWEAFEDADAVIMLHAEIMSKSQDAHIKNNILATRVVLAACKKYNVKKIIHVSSSVVIRKGDVFLPEEKKEDYYTFTKRMGEDYVEMSGIPYTILRPTLLYGQGDTKHLGLITRFMKISPIVPIPGSGKYIRQPVYVGDLCKIIVELTKRKPKNETWNVIGKEKKYFINILKMICEEKGWKRLFVNVPLPIFSFMLKIFGGFNTAQMKALVAGEVYPEPRWKEFGVEYTPLRKGIEEI